MQAHEQTDELTVNGLVNTLSIAQRRLCADIQVTPCDVGEARRFGAAPSKEQVIFGLAGKISHIHSMEYPERDLQISALAEPRFLQECARASCGVRVVSAGTHQIYGVPEFLPVDESHLISSVDFTGIHKYAAMMYHLTLSRMGHAVVLQLTNVYKPQDGFGCAAPRLCAGVFPQVSAESMDRDYGGLQLRDPVHVDDIIGTLLLAGQAQCAPARVYNLGAPTALSVAEMARILCAAGGAAARYRPFSETLKRINTGRYYSDCSSVKRELKWTPQIPLSRCVASTLAYFGHNLPHHFDFTRTCDCKLRELNDAWQRLTTA